jgi:hypothetical protein
MYSGASLFPPSFSSWHLITNHSVFFPSLIMTSHQWAISVGKQQRKMVGSCTIFLFRLVDLFLYYYYFYDLCRETWTICGRPPQSQCLPKFSLSFVACFVGEAGKKGGHWCCCLFVISYLFIGNSNTNVLRFSTFPFLLFSLHNELCIIDVGVHLY